MFICFCVFGNPAWLEVRDKYEANVPFVLRKFENMIQRLSKLTQYRQYRLRNKQMIYIRVSDRALKKPIKANLLEDLCVL